ncbi:CPBP family intramembrane glutamic endopeptidase [Streptomyces gobiensis]|uniref:CPBP family intramembrane glutamic endopeptidase n=1 Tax=Streptomyces gobiensis TaxID=2875706 RepID=UPI001E3CF2DF|nr:CPBP family intramembrane glutamic endopeptidase [Streptomyces gobiensis]UGY91320.1 CPBP family intramembrane metalloprotease [Streptomyces gobiensis]
MSQWPTPYPPPRRSRGVTTAPPGSGYTEQARNERRGCLREILGTLVLLLLTASFGAAVYLTAVITAVLLNAEPFRLQGDEIFDAPLPEQALALLLLATAIPATLLAARWVQRRPPGTLSSVTGRLRLRWLGYCFAVITPLLALQLGLLLLWAVLAGEADFSDTRFPGWQTVLLSLAVLWALVPFQAAAEEYVFRGWLLQAFGAMLRAPWLGVAISSVLFALAHGYGGLPGFLLLVYSAVWWAWLTMRTGGLEAVIALHSVNNMLAFALIVTTDALGEDPTTAAHASWQALVMELLFVPLYCLLLSHLAKRRNIETVSGGSGGSGGGSSSGSSGVSS